MCVIFIYVNSKPKPGHHKLIVASNRDEFFARKTMKAAKWTQAGDGIDVFGGIDMEAGREGGTWLAIGAKAGVFRLGALLNITGVTFSSTARGRGAIVKDFVMSGSVAGDGESIEDYNERLLKECEEYNGFNFLSVEFGKHTQPAQISLLSNIPPNLKHYTEGEFYGFGNSPWDSPLQKVLFGRRRFSEIVKSAQARDDCMRDQLVEDLLGMLKDKTCHWPDPELERRARDWSRGLSALNVNISESQYGTRTHTIILIDDENNMHYVEETMDDAGPSKDWHRTCIQRKFAY